MPLLQGFLPRSRLFLLRSHALRCLLAIDNPRRQPSGALPLLRKGRDERLPLVGALAQFTPLGTTGMRGKARLPPGFLWWEAVGRKGGEKQMTFEEVIALGQGKASRRGGNYPLLV